MVASLLMCTVVRMQFVLNTLEFPILGLYYNFNKLCIAHLF